MSKTSTNEPVVVIGAGPYGLSVAATLRHRGIAVRIFGEPMDSWRQHVPAGMNLKSLSDTSDLFAPEPGYTLADYCRLHGLPEQRHISPVSAALFTEYGLWFQRTLVPEVEQVRVERIGRAGSGFLVDLATGEQVAASAVVLATGLGGYTHIPPELAGAPGRVTHSWQHHDSRTYADRDVVVVGAGQSALEGAILLHEAGARVQMLSRQAPQIVDKPRFVGDREHSSVFDPQTPMGNGYLLLALDTFPGAFRRLPGGLRQRAATRILGPFGSWWLRDRAVGRFPMRSGVRILGSRPVADRVELSIVDQAGATDTVVADHVIAATGYRVDVDRIDILAPEIRAAMRRVGTWPALDGSFQTSVAGLYVVGPPAAVTFGPLVRFVCGTGFAARRVSRALANRRVGTKAPVLA